MSGPEQTGREMIRLIRSYANDLQALAYLPLEWFFHFVSMLPYRKDPKQVEFIQRPYYSLKDTPFRDCDDKSILMASWAYLRKIPVRLVAGGKGRQLTHVFPEFLIKGRWIAMDATYRGFMPGTQRKYGIKKVLGVLR